MQQTAAADPYHALLAQAIAHYRTGSYDECKAAFKHAIDLSPRRTEAYQQLMTVCEERADVDGLIDALVRWLTASPNDMKAVQELVNLCLNNRRYDPAIDQVRMLLRLEPDNMSLLNVMCLLHMESKRYVDGLEYFERAYHLHPNRTPDVIKAFAWVLYQAHHFSRALEIALSVADALMHDEEIYVLLASCHSALGDHAAHLKVYEQAMRNLPGNKTIECSLALALFMTTHMKQGFEEYESRWHSVYCTPRHYPVPQWRGESLTGKKLLIWAEQGVGDVTMFATLMPWLAAQGAARIVAGAEAKMVALMARSFPQFEWMDYDSQAFAGCAATSNFHAPMGDLMRYGLPHYTPSQHPSIYVPEPELKATLRARYEAVAKARGAKKIIGIAWHTKNDLNSMLRNIALPAWAPLFALEHVQFVSLQYGNHATDIASIEQQFPGALFVDEAVDAFASSDAAIAQVAAMDEIITIQNATAHFGGAVGVPTHLLLSIAADWRWGTARSDSVWYKSVTVHRQQEALNWQPLMEQMVQKLRG